MHKDWDLDETILCFKLRFFRKQDTAFQYVDSVNVRRCSQNLPMLHVFGREFSPDGRRYFVVEDLPTFFHKYMNMSPKDRTFYEIIRAGQPCRLYFDLE